MTIADFLNRVYTDLGCNWHRYIYGVCGMLLILALGVQHGQIPLPKEWAGIMEYVPFAIGVLNAFLPKASSEAPATK